MKTTNGWQDVALDEVLTEVQYGLSIPMKSSGMFPILRMAAIQDGRVILNDLKYVDLTDEVARRYTLRKNDVLLNRTNSGDLVGKVGTYGGELDSVVFASYLMRLKVDEKTDSRFVGHLLTSYPSQCKLRRYATPGVQQVNINAANVRKVIVSLPWGHDRAKQEQRAITAILDAADAATECTRDALRQARRLRQGVLQMLMTRGIDAKGLVRHPATSSFTATEIGRAPRDWEVVRLDAVATVGSGVTLGKDLTGQATIELPYLRVANVQAGYLNLDEIKTVRVRPDEVENFKLETGDILMTEGGDIDKLGRGAIWPGVIAPCLHQNHIFRVRANRERLDPRFLEAVICSDVGRRYFFRIAKRTTNLASINKTQLKAFRLPLPPILEQERIAAALEKADDQISAIEAREALLSALKRGLVQDLLTRKVRVPDALEVAPS